MSYLRAQLKGEASKVIGGFQLTNANYNHSVTLLQERFGQPHKQIDAHMQALINLPSPSQSYAVSSMMLWKVTFAVLHHSGRQ